MTPQSEAIDLIIGKIFENLNVRVKLSPLPEHGGITAEITGSESKGRYLNKQHGKEDLTVLFLCKNTSQQNAYETLTRIGNYLDALPPFDGESVSVTGAEKYSGAGLVGNDGGYYIYSMMTKISIYF